MSAVTAPYILDAVVPRHPAIIEAGVVPALDSEDCREGGLVPVVTVLDASLSAAVPTVVVALFVVVEGVAPPVPKTNTDALS